jgi:hypothetical protein
MEERFENMELDDVKEYKPKKRDPESKTNVHFMDNYNVSPAASDKMLEDEGRQDGVIHLDGGVMLTTSEVIDFSEGTDSWT